MIEGIIRRRWWIVAAWLVCAGAMLLFVPPSNPQLYEPASFLPAGMPSRQAAEAMTAIFPAEGGFAQAIILFERADGPLLPADLAFIEGIAARIAAPADPAAQALLQGIRVLSPAAIPLAGGQNPLISPISPAGQAAIIRVTLPTSFITVRTMKIMQHIRGLLRQADLARLGLRAALSGSAGFGSDYAEAVERSHRRALLVTILAVAVILGLVQRAPLAALLPLVAISLAAIVAVSLLSLLQRAGLHTGTAEEIFVVVLIYGAGVDYALLLTGRYREIFRPLATDPPAPPATLLPDPLSPPADLAAPPSAPSAVRAAAGSLRASAGTILAAAGSNILAMLMLTAARHDILRSTGPAVAIALAIALASTLTFVPALMAILGGWLFWPARRPAATPRRWLWPAVARMVTTRPLITMLVALAILSIPALRGTHLTWVYDALASIDARWDDGVGNSIAGSQIARRHWPIGEIAPVQILITAPHPLAAEQWEKLASRATSWLLDFRIPGSPEAKPVQNVRSLSDPLGRQVATRPASQAGGGLFGRLMSPSIALAQHFYLTADRKATRLDVVLNMPPFTLEAMNTVQEIRRQIPALLQQSPLLTADSRAVAARVYVGGTTSEMIDIRDVTRADFRRIALLVLLIILVVVTALLRDLLLALFMLACTVLSYFTTLGLTFWFFHTISSLFNMPAYAGLDWKVEVFLFVVIVAVGQDYNIFLMGRLMQESATAPPRVAARQALVHTGPVISSCGLIMAATLGSLAAGHLVLLVELGFALALGMLIDTFLVRPLLLPAFCTLTGRTGRPIRLLH